MEGPCFSRQPLRACPLFCFSCSYHNWLISSLFTLPGVCLFIQELLLPHAFCLLLISVMLSPATERKTLFVQHRSTVVGRTIRYSRFIDPRRLFWGSGTIMPSSISYVQGMGSQALSTEVLLAKGKPQKEAVGVAGSQRGPG